MAIPTLRWLFRCVKSIDVLTVRRPALVERHVLTLLGPAYDALYRDASIARYDHKEP